MAATTTPIGAALSAKYKSSFAYITIKDRLPVILSKIADSLYRNKEQIRDQYGDEGSEELKALIGKISKLRNEVQTNKPILILTDSDSDVIDWNNYLKEETERSNGENPTWFNNPWLYVECYMYRRIQEAVNLTRTLKHVDVFQEQKEETFLLSQSAVEA